MKRLISHTVEIDAKPDAVWATLTDTASFANWNPFIRSIDGQLQTGRKIAVTFTPPGGRASTFRPTVLVVAAGRELRWLGRLGIPGLIDGEHSFVLEPLPGDRTRITQAERFSGVLVRPLGRTLNKTETGFREMNEALKTRVEVCG
jgi:hypothetical protein